MARRVKFASISSPSVEPDNGQLVQNSRLRRYHLVLTLFQIHQAPTVDLDITHHTPSRDIGCISLPQEDLIVVHANGL